MFYTSRTFVVVALLLHQSSTTRVSTPKTKHLIHTKKWSKERKKHGLPSNKEGIKAGLKKKIELKSSGR